MATDPTDAALREYVRSRLQGIGGAFADAQEEIIAEALTSHRDLWVALYALDDPEFANF